MNYRELGRTGWQVSALSFGAWAIGGAWGNVDDRESLAALHRAVDLGVNFFDTADVYGDGHSECLLAQLKRERREEIFIATKAGRRLDPHIAAGYTLDDLVLQGKIRHYGVSVEQVEQGLKAIEYPGVQTVQIIFNIFRQRPADLFFAEAQRRRVGVFARLPLSSGLLSGKLTSNSRFAADDHRAFNRQGEAFDRGETFSGVDYERGLQAVEALRPYVPPGMTMAQMALRWILMFPAVTCA